MKIFDNYHLPTTVNEALTLLAQYDGRARVIAGGTDLLVDTQAEYHHGERPHFDALIDVTQIQGANEIRELLLKEYDVEPDRCERDLLVLLQKLASEGLIEVKDEPGT